MASEESTTAVSQELLERLAAIAGNAEPKASGRQNTSPPSGMLDVEALLDAHGIGYDYKTAPYGDVWPLHQCLTSDAHETGAVIIQFPNGALAYKCQHTRCRDKTWADAKAALGIVGRERPSGGTADAGGAGGPDPRILTLYTIGEYRKRPKPSWLVESVVVETTLVGLVGAYGTYKSFAALDMTLSVGSGRAWFGHATKQAPCAYVIGEGGGLIIERIDAWLKHHGVEDVPDFFLLPNAVQMLNEVEVDALIAALHERKVANGIVVLDTLNRTNSGDENSAQDMSRYVSAADRIRTETDSTVLILHHVGKSGDIRGSTSLPGALDTILMIERTSDGAVISCDKQKDAAPFASIALEKIVVNLDDFTDDASIDVRSSLVFVPSAGAHSDDYDGIDPLNPSQRKALQALVDSPQTWVSWTNWQPLTDIRSKGNFSKVANALLAEGWVEKKEEGRSSYFRATTEGEVVLEGKPLNPYEPRREPGFGAEQDGGVQGPPGHNPA